MFQACFVNTDELPVRTKHICYHVEYKESSHSVTIYEIYRATYKHPESDEIYVDIMQERVVSSVQAMSGKAHAAHILRHAEMNMRSIVDNKLI